MALLLLRHASSVPDSDGDGDEDASTFLTVSGNLYVIIIKHTRSKYYHKMFHFLKFVLNFVVRETTT